MTTLPLSHSQALGQREGPNAPVKCGTCGDPRSEMLDECEGCERPCCRDCLTGGLCARCAMEIEK
jgi:hypothetical protein